MYQSFADPLPGTATVTVGVLILWESVLTYDCPARIPGRIITAAMIRMTIIPPVIKGRGIAGLFLGIVAGEGEGVTGTGVSCLCCTGVVVSGVIEAPQLSQNFDPSSTCAPHCSQRREAMEK